MSEAAFQARVVGLARIYRWRVYHAPDNRPAGRTGRPQRLAAPEARGFPDLILLKDRRLIAAELKADGGRLQPGQDEWLSAFAAIPGATAYLWHPRDWPDIQHVLGAGEERRPDLDPLPLP